MIDKPLEPRQCVRATDQIREAYCVHYELMPVNTGVLPTGRKLVRAKFVIDFIK